MEGGVLQGAASNHPDLLHLHMWEDGDLIEDYPIDKIPTVGDYHKDSDNSNVRP